jgi:deoxyadenosine/deoxycytidine kinase
MKRYVLYIAMKIYVEGNIGSGKTRFIKCLARRKDLTVIEEPVEVWESIGALKAFYKDPQRFAYMFQSLAFATRLSTTLTTPVPTEHLVLERSIYTDRYCFTELQVECGNMSELEYRVYLEWYKLMECKFTNDIKADVIVYLRTTPEICAQRIKKRSRDGESGIAQEYLELLHKKHDKWLHGENQQNKNILTIDCSADMTEEEYEKFADNIIDKVIKKSEPVNMPWYDQS